MALGAEADAQLADALEQAVLADMDIRPDRAHQLLLAQDPPGIGQEHLQHGERFGPQPHSLAVGPAKFRALLVQFEAAKPQRRHCRQSPLTGAKYQEKPAKSSRPVAVTAQLGVAIDAVSFNAVSFAHQAVETGDRARF